MLLLSRSWRRPAGGTGDQVRGADRRERAQAEWEQDCFQVKIEPEPPESPFRTHILIWSCSKLNCRAETWWRCWCVCFNYEMMDKWNHHLGRLCCRRSPPLLYLIKIKRLCDPLVFRLDCFFPSKEQLCGWMCFALLIMELWRSARTHLSLL